MRELEREKREATKRYREQVRSPFSFTQCAPLMLSTTAKSETFESERQAWYDQEQHYKLRISNLSSTRRSSRNAGAGAGPGNRRQSAPLPSFDDRDEDESAAEDGDVGADGDPRTPTSANRSSSPTPSTTSATSSSAAPPSSSSSSAPQPSASEVALLAQLTSLTTSHSSLSTSLRSLQTELSDLKRVYQDLQEENESYEILLGEKTLSGELVGTELFRKSFQWGESGGNGAGAGEGGKGEWGSAFGFQGGLEAVGEEEGEDGAIGALASELPSDGEDDSSSDDDDDSEGEENEEEDGGKKTEEELDEIERILLESHGTGSVHSGAVGTSELSSSGRRRSRRTDSLVIQNSTRDASSAAAVAKKNKRPSLGVSGAVATLGGAGGLDLAAELEAADVDEEEEERQRVREERRERKKAEKEKRREERRKAKERARQQVHGMGRRESSFAGVSEGASFPSGSRLFPPLHSHSSITLSPLRTLAVELQAEIRQLREANKALTLYVSKIVDRVCSQEGFEKVLAVDYREKTPKTGATASPPMARSDSAVTAKGRSGEEEQTVAAAGGAQDGDSPKKKARPASAFFRTSLGASDSPSQNGGTSFAPSHALSSSLSSNSSASGTSSGAAGASGPRKSGGQLWESVSSVFGFSSSTSSATSTASSAPSNIKPLMLSDAAASARKLDPAEEIDEDEDDRRERERIRNEMLQAGFEPPPASALATAGATSQQHRPSLSTRPSYSSSTSIGSRSPALSSSLSLSTSTAPASPRTQEESRLASLARLERQETIAKAELQQGKASGFTEPPLRRFNSSRRHSSARSSTLSSRSGEGSEAGAEGLGLGLGIEERKEEEKDGGAQEEGKLGKAFKRLSTAWTSPAMQ